MKYSLKSTFSRWVLGLFFAVLALTVLGRAVAVTGAIAGTLVVLMVTENDFPLPRLYEWFAFDPIPFIWSTAIGLAVTLVVGFLISLAGPPTPPAQLEHTTLGGVSA